VLANQLLHLGSNHATVKDESVARTLAGVVPQIYRYAVHPTSSIKRAGPMAILKQTVYYSFLLLYRALSDLSEDEFESARAVIHGEPCVWVGNGFSKAIKVAFKVINLLKNEYVEGQHGK